MAFRVKVNKKIKVHMVKEFDSAWLTTRCRLRVQKRDQTERWSVWESDVTCPVCMLIIWEDE